MKNKEIIFLLRAKDSLVIVPFVALLYLITVGAFIEAQIRANDVGDNTSIGGKIACGIIFCITINILDNHKIHIVVDG